MQTLPGIAFAVRVAEIVGAALSPYTRYWNGLTAGAVTG
jgi:hypothetical protein